ncbi:MAG: hypothetical protein EU533_07685 [Promethearchaeota archaeon]|nr:MAG: hypothetical protein EU533_07685 [Candidatus Lokiarchaeota archaeon]
MLPGIILISVVVPNFVLPFPESVGFYNVVLAYLNVIFFAADFGLKNASERYIAEYAETAPHVAVKYVSFFIWFQMLTGLLQITVISIFSIIILPQTNMSYAVWFFLVYIMVQWPGTIGIFQVALNGFQQFDKSNILYVIQNFAVQVATAVGFIYLGRWIGAQNPEIGELMGATMGFILGMYVDDLIGFVLGLKFFNETLKPFGMTVKQAFIISFDKKLVKEVLWYGGRVMPSGLSFYAVSFLITLMVTMWLWNYSTLIGLYFIASTLVGALSMTFPMTSPLSEAYNNGKKQLALYYIRGQFLWWGIITFGIFLLPILLLFPLVLANLGGEFAEASWMIFPLFIPAILLLPSNLSGIVCEACDIPQQSTFMNFIEQGTRLITYFFVLNPYMGVGVLIGKENVLIFWLLAEAPGYISKGIYGWWTVKRKLFPGEKLQIPFKQTFLLPIIAILPIIPLVLVFVRIFEVLFAVNQIGGLIFIAIIIITMLYLIPAFIFMPIYGFLGAWDPQSIEDFRKAAIISGPSRGIVMRLYKSTKFGYERSPWKDRCIIPYEKACKEAQELYEIRKTKEEAVKV